MSNTTSPSAKRGTSHSFTWRKKQTNKVLSESWKVFSRIICCRQTGWLYVFGRLWWWGKAHFQWKMLVWLSGFLLQSNVGHKGKYDWMVGWACRSHAKKRIALWRYKAWHGSCWVWDFETSQVVYQEQTGMSKLLYVSSRSTNFKRNCTKTCRGNFKWLFLSWSDIWS